jgi:hypothetical protein
MGADTRLGLSLPDEYPTTLKGIEQFEDFC